MSPKLRRILVYAGAAVVLFILGTLTTLQIVLGSPGFPKFAEPVPTENGLVQGVVARNGVTIYRGIPFAAPPVGNLRWRAPQPAASWSGVYKAAVFRHVCMQEGATVPGLAVEPMSEDCLYLNVWTAAKRANEKRAVMVYLFGGGNVTGSGSARLYGGDVLAEKGVVVVTFNYRLGVLGSLAHPELTQESGASGNYHLRDEIAALNWVRRNIASFGGDPGNVTVFGQSAGAFHASMLMASPQTRGLFHRVAAHSGGSFAPTGHEFGTMTLQQAERQGLDFARALGAASLAELRAIPARQLLSVAYRSRAIIDGDIIAEQTYDVFAAGRQAHVPLLVGYNRDEREMPHKWPIWTWARLHAQSQPGSTFVYHFAHVPPFGPFPRTGAAHGAELLYVFGYPPAVVHHVVELPWTARRHIALGDEIRSYWTNFARTGNPNSAGLPHWPSFASRQQVLELADTHRVIDMPDREAHAAMDAEMARLRETTQAALAPEPVR